MSGAFALSPGTIAALEWPPRTTASASSSRKPFIYLRHDKPAFLHEHRLDFTREITAVARRAQRLPRKGSAR
jgi:hypothetical protein